jgi:hypothetical protein
MSWDTQSKNIINIGNYYYLFDVKPKRFKNGWPRNKNYFYINTENP